MATTEATVSTQRLDAFMDAWNAHDVEAIVAFFADDCVFHTSVGPELMGATYRGREEVRQGVEAFFERFPGARFEDASCFVAGDRGASEWTFCWKGQDGDGTENTVRGCDLFEFAGEKIRVKNAFRKNRS